jgi:hypothetical protein
VGSGTIVFLLIIKIFLLSQQKQVKNEIEDRLASQITSVEQLVMTTNSLLGETCLFRLSCMVFRF